MRWRDLLAGRTVADPLQRLSAPTGRVVLRRINADALGLRDPGTGRAIAWDSPEATRLGLITAAVVPPPGGETDLDADDAAPGTELLLVARGKRVEVADPMGRRTLGVLDDPAPVLARFRAGIPMRAIALRRVIDLAGRRTHLDVLVVPATVTVEVARADAPA